MFNTKLYTHTVLFESNQFNGKCLYLKKKEKKNQKFPPFAINKQCIQHINDALGN